LRPVPDSEVVAKPKRRQYTAEYKLQIVQAADLCKEPGAIGALLRKEGLYSSLLGKWRKQRQLGELEGPGKARGRKVDAATELKRQVHQLERDKARLERKLRHAEAIIEVQKKVSEILGISLATPPDEETG
jgi:transposase-like protein